MINLNNSNWQLQVGAKIDTSQIQKDLQKLSSKTTIQIRANIDGQNFKNANKEVTKYKNELGQVVSVTKLTDQATGKMSQSITSITESTKKASQGFTDIIGKVLKFGAATLVINEVRIALMDGVQAVFDMDAALTEFRKVSDLTGESLEAYTQKAGEMGEVVARSAREIILAATEFKKSGFSESDSLILAQQASMFQNIADSEVSAADSASFLIATMKGFNITAEETQRILDVTNEVNITAFDELYRLKSRDG